MSQMNKSFQNSTFFSDKINRTNLRMSDQLSPTSLKLVEHQDAPAVGNFCMGICHGKMLSKFHFQFIACTSTGSIVLIPHISTWMMFKNYYLCWFMIIFPTKNPFTNAAAQSHWVKSPQKDVKCIFRNIEQKF